MIVAHATFAQNNDATLVVSDKDKGELFGNVKSVTGSVYDAIRSNGTVKKTQLYMSSTVDYDQHGFGTRMIMPNANTTYKNVYGNDGRIESVKTYVNGSYDGNSSFTYEPGCATERVYDSNGIQTGTVVHTRGKSIMNTKDDSDGSETTMTTFYDTKNQAVKVETLIKYGTVLPVMTIILTYNSHSAIENIKLSTPEGSADIKYSAYKYDDHGNWIYRVKSQDQMGVRIEERVIEYYDE